MNPVTLAKGCTEAINDDAFILLAVALEHVRELAGAEAVDIGDEVPIVLERPCPLGKVETLEGDRCEVAFDPYDLLGWMLARGLIRLVDVKAIHMSEGGEA